VLLLAAAPDRDDPGDQLALARVRELLDDWEGARVLFLGALQRNADDLPALLGASRTCLLLRDADASRAYASRACDVASPPAEAYFARGAAGLALGQDAAAGLDFTKACRLDASLTPRVHALLSRRNGLR
jgi:hypothetical protein